MPDQNESRSIELGELIEHVKRELMRPGTADDAYPLLAVEEVELEIEVTGSKRAEAGLNIQVIALGGGGERNDVHKVRVRLVPLLTRDERLAQLRQDARWDEIIRQQVGSTLKEPRAVNPKSQF